MDATQAVILVGIGLFGGIWNAVAGGATLFTFPALMAVGLPSVVANATNYVALFPSNAAALPAYREELRGVGGQLLPLLVVSGLGAVVGSLLLLASDPDFFVALIPFLILLATGLFAFGDALRAWLLRKIGDGHGRTAIYATLFVSSIYGGYFGAGLGIILLAIAQLMGFTNFHTANSIKNLLATSFTLLSIIVFGVGGLIAWPQAVAMMVGSTIGGYVGGRLARRVNTRYLRGVVIAFGLVLSLVYFFRTFA
ncbi:sulfite exporter TauE/SafE family protein [Rhodospirillaceae bacterium KN72]|uniref:Probable membrane transporter protein n=1 Tax=Pacificispira spongiicola TaxID=2729598 RepID=A0A7Y0HEE5_9PROT|nr:sulfite exporter TauE/SafE family protein [Pacificispira spongiicola]NMM44781.1 sulfite exporter TauE/SafE family protein [Pacificispira spongiicola]